MIDGNTKCKCGHSKSHHLRLEDNEICLNNSTCSCTGFVLQQARTHAKPRDGMISCDAGHMLSEEYRGEPCPVCELIEIAKETWDAGEWCHLEIRDRLGKVLTALGVDLMKG